MTREKKLLRQQLELLAEQSKGATDSELARLSAAMCEVYKTLFSECLHKCLVGALLFAICLYLVAGILIHI